MKVKRERSISGHLKVWTVILMLTALLLALTISVMALDTDVSVPNKQADGETSAVSPALHILAARTEMAVATLCGNEYYFSRDVFARCMNLDVGAIQYITIEQLPGVTEGELLIGSMRVSEGQVISASNLQMLSFVAADDTAPSASCFRFRVNENAYALDCNVYVLDQINYAPTLSIAGEQALSVSTHRDFAGFGTLTAYDPEGDALTFEIVKAPEHGLVILTDPSCGEYVYLPRIGYKGSDSFTYIAKDIYGNYSAAAQVKVQVREPAISVDFVDLVGRKEYNAALTMAEAGIMQGSVSNDQTYFYPEEAVTRLDFLMMAMKAIGVGSVPSVADTGFYDDEAIPSDAKGYVAAAYSLGYIKGSSNDAGELCFMPNETITRAQAAVILRRMVDVKDAQLTPAFADSSDIPAWASEAISTLSCMGVMTPTSGAISPNEVVTRGQTAMMLAALKEIVN